MELLSNREMHQENFYMFRYVSQFSKYWWLETALAYYDNVKKNNKN